jgi:hypothetical protein
MTGIAAPWRHHPAMDHPSPAEGCRGLVTGLAGRGGRKMVCRLAHDPRIPAAMTGHTTRHYSRVVIDGPRKRRRGLVTGLAGGGGWEVVRRLAHDPRIPAAMTGCTAGHDPRVIHRSPWPEGRRRFVARLAPQRRGNVCRWFAQGRPAVMTARTAGRDPRVIKSGPHKRRGGLVTTLAGRGSRNVRRRFRHDPGIPAAVTGRTAGCDPRVIHRSPWPEGRRRFVARIARLGRRNMRRRLACCLGAVVAAGASSLHHT